MRTLLIIYPHFYPAWKDGGIVQSLNNTVKLLSQDMNVRVITTAYDREESEVLNGVTLNEWNDVFDAKVYYRTKEEENPAVLKRLIQESGCDIIYLNSMFAIPYVLEPLKIWRSTLKGKAKVILAPRGMLQKGALQVKPLKKKAFLSFLKLSGLVKNVHWHATDEQEYQDIKKIFGKGTIVTVTKDVPKESVRSFEKIDKQTGELRLTYISLIAEKKNLHLALELLSELSEEITFDIYGPIKDEAYWERCKTVLQQMPANIKATYKGGVVPDDILKTFSKYHALILPTNAENFGHAIYECLSVGRPVIISDKTPWNNLEENKAGYNIPVENREKYKDAIRALYQMDADRYRELCDHANMLAVNYWQQNNFRKMYLDLFNS